jgi:hypothetical protein
MPKKHGKFYQENRDKPWAGMGYPIFRETPYSYPRISTALDPSNGTNALATTP